MTRLSTTVRDWASASFDGSRPVRSLLRVYVFANAMALAIAFGLGGPGDLTGTARTAFAWCGIG